MSFRGEQSSMAAPPPAAPAAPGPRRQRPWAAGLVGAALMVSLAGALADTHGLSSDLHREQPGEPPPGYHSLVESLNGSAQGRQLIPLLEQGLAAPSDYLLGYSHNPWGASAAMGEVLEQLEQLGHLENLENLGTAPPAAPQSRRRRRSVVHLYNMLVCATGCNPMAFKGYGCYCGFLGSGYTVDGIDRCCKMHDWCYDTANCPMFLEYFVPYLWKCYRRRPVCAVNGSACSQRLCECDRRLAECLRRYPCPRRKAVCTSSPWRLLQNLFML